MEVMVHIANVIYMFSYLVRDILWLRVLTVVAATSLLPYFYFRPDPLMAPIYWNLLFTTLNVYWIGHLLLERRPVALKEDEARLYQLVFRTVTPREMLHLLRIGSWENAVPRECFVQRGSTLDRFMVIYSGTASVEVDGKSVALLREGNCIGAMDYYTDQPASANVVAVEPTRYVAWAKPRLKQFLESNPPLRAAFQMILGRELATRLQASLTSKKEGTS